MRRASRRSTRLGAAAAVLAASLVTTTAPTTTQAQAARDYITIVGSSTVYPFATVVAEQFGKATRFKTPKIESTGSGGGLKLFCAGMGVQHPDIANTSRRIKRSEMDACARNGVADIVEIKIGYDGIVVASSRKGARVSITRRQIWLALAREVPDPGDPTRLILNPYETWRQIDSTLPPRPIRVLGPPPTSGTRDVFAELALEGGCGTFPEILAIRESDTSRYRALCHTVREDGAYVDAGENDNLIVQKLAADPGAFGVFGFSFLDQNTDRLQGALVDAVEPTFENIADGTYPLARPLYFYVKKAHIGSIPGLEEFIREFTSEGIWGEEGYLAERGMIPLPRDERELFGGVATRQEGIEVCGEPCGGLYREARCVCP